MFLNVISNAIITVFLWMQAVWPDLAEGVLIFTHSFFLNVSINSLSVNAGSLIWQKAGDQLGARVLNSSTWPAGAKIKSYHGDDNDGDGHGGDDDDAGDEDADCDDYRFQLISGSNHINPHLHVDWSASEKLKRHQHQLSSASASASASASPSPSPSALPSPSPSPSPLSPLSSSS